MNSGRSGFLASVALSLLLIGCQKAAEPPKPVTSNAPSANANESVAAPPNAVPPSDASMKPAPSVASAGPTNSGDANGPTQATPKELDKAQESGAMPLTGQVNNHSAPVTTGEKK
jgi:hypothetical protein